MVNVADGAGAIEAALCVLAGASSLHAAPIEPEDHHHRPPEYDDPTLQVPPFAAPSEYPLAAGFIPADPTNYTAGALGEVQYIVVHTMQGSYAGSISWFQNPTADVSAHFCMRSSDGEITQMVGLDDRAWHVGSQNSWSVGIEHEGFVDDPSWYTWATYTSSALLTRWLASHYGVPIDRDHIRGHVELPDQTHTDPGPYWNWDLYMALVLDVVPAARVEGVVVDRGKACTLVANTDTWIKRTLEDEDGLAEPDKCAIAAGAELTVVHASGDLYGHRRLTMDGGGPCAGLGELDFEAFARPEHWDGWCAPEDLAATGASIAIDGGAAIAVGPDGSFAFEGVAEGPHVLDVPATATTLATSQPVDVVVYPGSRVIVRVDPAAGGGSDDAGDGAGSSDGGDLDDGAVETTGEDPPGGSSGGGVDEALPDTYGDADDGQGCGCRPASGSPARALTGVLVLVVGLRRRRRRWPELGRG
jgi:MYXO-CTERM domain-containing protein